MMPLVLVADCPKGEWVLRDKGLQCAVTHTVDHSSNAH